MFDHDDLTSDGGIGDDEGDAYYSEVAEDHPDNYVLKDLSTRKKLYQIIFWGF